MPTHAAEQVLPNAIRAAWPPDGWRGTHVVVAVSGGADSVALLAGLLEVKQAAGGAGRVFAAHFNHGTRGKESDADERFVRRLCDRLGVALECGRAGAEETLASEQAARDARYTFLRAAAEALGARYVATAHTADDQLETILLRVLRGAGLAGLAGVPQQRRLGPAVTVARPLLGVRRAEVEAYLAARRQPYCTDATNLDDCFARNRVRGELLPMLRERFGAGVDEALLRLSGQATEAQEVIACLARDAAARSIQPLEPDARGQRGLAVNPEGLTEAPPLVAREAVRLAWREAGWPEQAMGAREWRRVHALLVEGPDAPPINLPGGVDARWVGERVVLRRAAARRPGMLAIDRGG